MPPHCSRGSFRVSTSHHASFTPCSRAVFGITQHKELLLRYFPVTSHFADVHTSMEFPSSGYNCSACALKMNSPGGPKITRFTVRYKSATTLEPPHTEDKNDHGGTLTTYINAEQVHPPFHCNITMNSMRGTNTKSEAALLLG